jgi:exonuclease III
MKNTRPTTNNQPTTTNGTIIDHILCSEDMTIKEYNTIIPATEDLPVNGIISDHYPIYSKLTF